MKFIQASSFYFLHPECTEQWIRNLSKHFGKKEYKFEVFTSYMYYLKDKQIKPTKNLKIYHLFTKEINELLLDNILSKNLLIEYLELPKKHKGDKMIEQTEKVYEESLRDHNKKLNQKKSEGYK